MNKGKTVNQISDGADALSDVLAVNSALTTLDLSCEIHDCGTDFMKGAHITSKYETVNNIGIAGARKLSEALKVNRTLATLNLRRKHRHWRADRMKKHPSNAMSNNRPDNEIGAGVRELCDALKANTTLRTLVLAGESLQQRRKG